MSQPEEIQENLALRGCYYFKGFGMILSDLLANLEIFAVAESTPEYAEHVRLRLDQISALYENIPPAQLSSHPDCDLLLSIKEAIRSLKPLVEEVLSSRENFEAAAAMIVRIHHAGQEYRSRLTGVQSRLRAIPGHETDGLRATSVIDGGVWMSALG